MTCNVFVFFYFAEYNIILHPGCNESSTTGSTCGAGTVDPSTTSEFTPDVNGVRVAQSLVFGVVILKIHVCPLFFFLLVVPSVFSNVY